ncbi:MAG: acetate--CoA ligase family protein [Candidatus Micrarchaeia archaeon]
MGTLIDYVEAEKLLKKYNIKSVESMYVNTAEEAIGFSKGKRIVLKVLSQEAMHKSKNGLVELDLSTESAIKEAFERLKKKARNFKQYKILAQKMVNNGIEIIIGGNTDPQFGKLVIVGLGGIYVETFKDFASRVCPIREYDAESMINQLKSKDIIAKDEKTRKQIVSLLMNVSRLFYENNITEIDLNPIIIHDGTYDAVDLRFIR